MENFRQVSSAESAKVLAEVARSGLGLTRELACHDQRKRDLTPCTVRRDTDLEATLVAKYVVMGPLLNERTRRLWAAAESIAIGFGGDAIARRPRDWPARRFGTGVTNWPKA